MNTQIMLDKIRVASPCHARWEDMTGDERARFCGQCQKNVFNLSAMTAPEIEILVRDKEGRFCARFYQRTDERMLTADCPVGWRRRRDRVTRICGSVFATLLFLLGIRFSLRAQSTNASTQGGITSTNSPNTNRPSEWIGDVAVPPTVMGRIALPSEKMGEIYLPQTSQPLRTNSHIPSGQKGQDEKKK